MSEAFVVDFSGVNNGGNKKYYIEPGTYKATVISVEKDIKPDKEYPFLIWKFNVEGVELSNYTTLNPKGLFKLYDTLTALGMDVPKSSVSVNPKNFIGKSCVVSVIDEEYNGKIYSKIKDLTRLAATAPTSGDDDL